MNQRALRSPFPLRCSAWTAVMGLVLASAGTGCSSLSGPGSASQLKSAGSDKAGGLK